MMVTMFSAKNYDQQFFDTELVAADDLQFRYLPIKLSDATAPLAKGCEVICCFVNDHLHARVLEELAAGGTRLVAMRCAGYNNVDVERAKKLGITVCRVPEYSPHAVAEHAVALILDLNRNIHRAHNRVRENDYSIEGLMGFDLHGRTVGVVGYGKIGQVFARILAGFGCQVLVSDPMLDAARSLDGARACTLEELLRRSDIVSLHCPLTPATYHLIDAETIATMKDGVMLINTSRGALIDTVAVIQGLKRKKIGYLGIDVYEEEADLFFEDLSNMVIQDDVFARLQTFPNVIITGHQAFFTREALTAIARTTLDNIRGFLRRDLSRVHRVTG